MKFAKYVYLEKTRSTLTLTYDKMRKDLEMILTDLKARHLNQVFSQVARLHNQYDEHMHYYSLSANYQTVYLRVFELSSEAKPSRCNQMLSLKLLFARTRSRN